MITCNIHRVNKSTYLWSTLLVTRGCRIVTHSMHISTAPLRVASEWLKVDAQKCHLQFLLILTVWHRRSTGSVLVLWVPVDCAVLAVLVFTSVCQSNPFDSHVCLGVLRVTLCSCNVLRLQHYQQKWIWAPSPLTSPSLAQYPLPLGQPACPLLGWGWSMQRGVEGQCHTYLWSVWEVCVCVCVSVNLFCSWFFKSMCVCVCHKERAHVGKKSLP